MILEAKNILYSYKSKRDKIVLKNVSATFEEATFYAIVGSSGQAKPPFCPFWRDWIIRYRETSFMVARTSAKRD